MLTESTKTIQDFLWSEGGETESFKKMTTRMIHTSTKDTEEDDSITRHAYIYIVIEILFIFLHVSTSIVEFFDVRAHVFASV